mmetsp:Transcript_6474/g.18335  ORF Transcript_6474/g.18335 Transcript_6474/m.18335 type:complete len:294 (+) Transcript_6474:423-1304(+)
MFSASSLSFAATSSSARCRSSRRNFSPLSRLSSSSSCFAPSSSMALMRDLTPASSAATSVSRVYASKSSPSTKSSSSSASSSSWRSTSASASASVMAHMGRAFPLAPLPLVLPLASALASTLASSSLASAASFASALLSSSVSGTAENMPFSSASASSFSSCADSTNLSSTSAGAVKSTSSSRTILRIFASRFMKRSRASFFFSSCSTNSASRRSLVTCSSLSHFLCFTSAVSFLARTPRLAFFSFVSRGGAMPTSRGTVPHTNDDACACAPCAARPAAAAPAKGRLHSITPL